MRTRLQSFFGWTGTPNLRGLGWSFLLGALLALNSNLQWLGLALSSGIVLAAAVAFLYLKVGQEKAKQWIVTMIIYYIALHLGILVTAVQKLLSLIGTLPSHNIMF